MVSKKNTDYDNKIVYHLNIDEETINLLMHISSLKMTKINRRIKSLLLVTAFYTFSLAFYSYLFNVSFAWIVLLLSLGYVALSLSVEKFQKIFMKAIINHRKSQLKGERKYVFSKEGVDTITEIGLTHNYWNSFVSKGEIKNHIYLTRKDYRVILIDKNVLSENKLLLLKNFIKNIKPEQIEAKKKMPFKTKFLMVVTLITIMLSLIYIGIKIGYPLSNGDIFRLWFIKTVPIVLFLILLCLNITWTWILSRIRKSLFAKILLWLAGIIIALFMTLGIFINALNDTSEHYNNNGTVIVETSVWLDKPLFKLYKEKNILVLQFLRNQDNNKNESSLTDESSSIDKQESEQNQNIDEGYLKIYETYIKKDNTEFKKNYDPKGYSYIVIFDDSTQIRYLMFDRDNQEENTARYIYYKNIKHPDGSWSMMDSEILDMYQYNYKSKEIKDLHQTSW